MEKWIVTFADGTVIAEGETFRAAAIEALREELEANGIDKDTVSDSELQGGLDASDFTCKRVS